MSSLVHVSSSTLVLSAPFIPHPIMRGTSSIQTPSVWQQQMGPASPLMVRRTFSYASPATPTHSHFASLKLLSPFSVRIFGTPSPPGRRRRSEATGYRLLLYNASIYQPCNSYHRVFSRQLPGPDTHRRLLRCVQTGASSATPFPC